MEIQLKLEVAEIELVDKLIHQELSGDVEMDINQHRNKLREITKKLDEQKREAIVPQK